METDGMRCFANGLRAMQEHNLIKEIHYEPMYGDINRFSLFLKDGNTINVNSYNICYLVFV